MPYLLISRSIRLKVPRWPGIIGFFFDLRGTTCSCTSVTGSNPSADARLSAKSCPHRADAVDSYCPGCGSDEWDDGKVAEMQDRVGYLDGRNPVATRTLS